MNRKLSDMQIALAVETLRGEGRGIGWRRLQAILIQAHGAGGRTDRLRAACRVANERSQEPALVEQLRRRTSEAEQTREEAQRERDLALGRALRAEARETAHQDRWAAEIHSLRESVEQFKGERVRRQHLEEQVLRLQRELQGLYNRLARYEG